MLGHREAVEGPQAGEPPPQVAALLAQSDIVREKVEAGRLGVAGARYDLDTGKVTLL